MKFKMIQLDVVLLCLTFNEITILPHIVFIGFKYAVLSYLLLRYIPTANNMPLIIIPTVLFGVENVFSTVINNGSQNSTVASMVFAVQVLVIFLVTDNFLGKYSLEEYAATALAAFGVLIVITDGLMLVKHYRFSNPNERYFIGDKFVVSYLHCFVSALLFMLSYKTERVWKISSGKLILNGLSLRLGAFAFTGFSVLVCRKVTCSTGMLACVLLFVMMLVPIGVRIVLSSGKAMIIVTSVLDVLLLGSYSILKNDFVHEFIYGTLEKSVTWNGRLIIWKEVFRLIGKKPVFGYGYYSNVVQEVVGFDANPQNGVLKILIDMGILGLVLFGVMVWISFRNIRGEALKKLYPVVAFMYPMIFASLVEINLTHMIVFMAMAIAYSGTRYIRRGQLI